MISRCIGLRLQPSADELGRPASRAARDGDGRSPSRPKSLEVATSPRPKWYCQSRLTITRVGQRVVGPGQPAGQGRPPAGRVGRRRRAARSWPASGRAASGSPARSRCLVRSPGIVVGGAIGPTSVDRQDACGRGSGLSRSNLASCFCSASPRGLVLALLQLASSLSCSSSDLAVGEVGELLLERRPLAAGLREDRLGLVGELVDRALGRLLAGGAARSRSISRAISAVLRLPGGRASPGTRATRSAGASGRSSRGRSGVKNAWSR